MAKSKAILENLNAPLKTNTLYMLTNIVLDVLGHREKLSQDDLRTYKIMFVLLKGTTASFENTLFPYRAPVFNSMKANIAITLAGHSDEPKNELFDFVIEAVTQMIQRYNVPPCSIHTGRDPGLLIDACLQKLIPFLEQCLKSFSQEQKSSAIKKLYDLYEMSYPIELPQQFDQQLNQDAYLKSTYTALLQFHKNFVKFYSPYYAQSRSVDTPSNETLIPDSLEYS